MKITMNGMIGSMSILIVILGLFIITMSFEVCNAADNSFREVGVSTQNGVRYYQPQNVGQKGWKLLCQNSTTIYEYDPCSIKTDEYGDKQIWIRFKNREGILMQRATFDKSGKFFFVDMTIGYDSNGNFISSNFSVNERYTVYENTYEEVLACDILKLPGN